MRLFASLNLEHIMLYVFPTLVFMVVFGVGLGFFHFRGRDDDRRHREITGEFADGIQDRNAPFPLVMFLMVLGAVLWAVAYILMTGLMERKI